MKVSLEPNINGDTTSVPHIVNVEITSATIDLETTFRIPMYTKGANYAASVCGYEVTSDTPDTTLALVEKLIDGLINMARLPTYVFIARRSRKMYPVYTIGSEVFAVSRREGPVFKHIELAKVREYITEYMNKIGELGAPGKSEKLRVRGVNRTNLALIRPIFYLKKRPVGNDDNEFWAPVFPADDGSTIYTYAASGKRETEVDQGHEAFRLRLQAAQALVADRRLKDENDLRADRFLPEYWQQIKTSLIPQGSALVFGDTRFEVFKEGANFVAVEYRTDEDRYSVYIGKSMDALRERAAIDLVRRGLISSDAALKIEG